MDDIARRHLKITIEKWTGLPCRECNGSMICSYCKGRGEVKTGVFKRELCPICEGGEACKVCLGSNTYELYDYVLFDSLSKVVQDFIRSNRKPWHKIIS